MSSLPILTNGQNQLQPLPFHNKNTVYIPVAPDIPSSLSYQPSERWKFLKELYDIGDYKALLTEAQQLKKNHPHFMADSLNIMCARSSFRSTDDWQTAWHKGNIFLSQITPQNIEKFALAKVSLHAQGLQHFLSKKDTFIGSPLNFKIHLENDSAANLIAPEIQSRYQYLILAHSLSRFDFPNYHQQKPEALSKIMDFEVRKAVDRLDSLCIARQKQKIKSPWIATGLSALLPGAGHAYLGRWGQALAVFFTSAALLTQTIEGHYKHSDLQKYTFGTLFTGYYFFNLYNTQLNARLQNQHYNERYEHELAQEVDAIMRTYLQR